jgi:hypothetical protein
VEGFDDRDPSLVELRGAGWGAAACDAVGLLDQRDADLLRKGSLGRRHEIRGLHPSAGPVTEDERCSRRLCRMQVRAGRTPWSLDLEDLDARDFVLRGLRLKSGGPG